MKTKTYAFCRTFAYLTKILTIALLITGGADAFAQAKPRHIYELIATNNNSKVTTVFQVYAESERDAKENVAANGWQVLSIRQLTYEKLDMVPVQMGDGEIKYIATPGEGLGGIAPDNVTPVKEGHLSDEDLIASILRANAPTLPEGAYPEGYVVSEASFPGTAGASGGGGGSDTGGSSGTGRNGSSGINGAGLGKGAGGAPLRGDFDMLGITPDSADLTYVFSIYFEFSAVNPILNDEVIRKIRTLDKDSYYLFGHTDNIRVKENPYYKDNFELSFKRAEAVKVLLINHGINPANINTVGLGSLYPVVVNQPGGTLENRRVEIYEYKPKK